MITSGSENVGVFPLPARSPPCPPDFKIIGITHENEHRRAGVEESPERLGPTGRLVLYTSEKQRYTRVRGRDESDQL